MKTHLNKTLSAVAICLTIVTTGSQAWDGGNGSGYDSVGYRGGGSCNNPNPYYAGAYSGGWNGAYCNGGGYGGSSSFGNKYGQWGNGNGGTLNGIAAIVAAFAPMLAQPQQQIIVRQ
jgi:hypothetical protein